MALAVGADIKVGPDRYVVTHVWDDGSALLALIPDGMQPDDLGLKFNGPRVDRIRDGATSPQDVLAQVEAAFAASLPKSAANGRPRILYPEQVPAGMTPILWQASNRAPGGQVLPPEAIGQTLAALVDMGGATRCERIEVGQRRDSSAAMFTVRGWR